MTDPQKSPYRHIDLERQRIRAVYALIIYGDALRKLPDLAGTAEDAKTIERVQKWFCAASDEIVADAVRTKYERNFKISWAKYLRAIAQIRKNPAFHQAAIFMAGAYLILDARITCPGVARTRVWHYLAKASDKLEDFLESAFPGCDQAGSEIYEKLAWEAERAEA